MHAVRTITTGTLYHHTGTYAHISRTCIHHVCHAAAGCLLLMMAVLLLVNKLRKRREREQQNLPRLPTRSLPDASALTCDIGAQSTSNIQTTAKVPAREDRIRDKTAARKAPEAAVVPDRIPEMIALEAVASARQPDPDGLMHASHDSEIVSQVHLPCHNSLWLELHSIHS